ncbi:uncharacterized protein VTP21DRAFT_8443 [Calcarisporiella thermophila]|uniref:uncharacterized protein n=1 Tax=Calcarisporiella thermophila TaxID=911321 RepID=UPI003742F65E
MVEAKLAEHTSGETSWQEFVETELRSYTTSSNVQDRLDFFKHRLLVRLRRKDLSEPLLPSIVQLLFLTYPRYEDRPSRQMVLQMFSELNEWNSKAFLNVIVPILTKEVEKTHKRSPEGVISSAVSLRFVLLTWANHLIGCALTSSTPDASPHWQVLVNAQAILMDGIAGEQRKGLRESSFVDTRRCIRKNASAIPAYFSLLTKGTTNPPYRNAVLLGIVIDVALRLKSMDGKELVEKEKESIIKFYLTNILASKQKVTGPAMNAFHDFIANIVSEADFRDVIAPQLEKVILRSPEVVLKVVSHFIDAITFDPSNVFKTKLIDPWLNQLRSSNPAVRADAFTLWDSFTAKSRDADNIVAITEHLSKQLVGGKISNWEHRQLFYQCMGKLSRQKLNSVSEANGEVLVAQIAKELNENALVAAVMALGDHLVVLVPSEGGKATVTKAVTAATTGLGSAKFNVRKAWSSIVAKLIWEQGLNPSDTLRTCAFKLFAPMMATLEKIQASPLAFPGGPLEGYEAIAIAEGRLKNWNSPEIGAILKDKKFRDIILCQTPKPSFLYWEKLYTKLTSDDEGLWLSRALESLLINEDLKSYSNARDAIGYALIYLLVGSPFHSTRQATFEMLHRCNLQKPDRVGEIMRNGLMRWLKEIESMSKDSLPCTVSASLVRQTEAQRLSSVINSITLFSPDADKSLLERILVDIAILAHHPRIATSDSWNWISLIQRAGINPGMLVEVHKEELVQIITTYLESSDKSKYFREAALSLATSLVFISPESIIPMIVDQCCKDLETKQLDGITEQELTIWKGEEGVLVVDVLKRGNKYVEDPNRRGYATEKWERELRENIAKKKQQSTTVKLSKEEQAIVDAQLAKESSIRHQVQTVHDKFLRGLDLIRSMTKGSDQIIGSLPLLVKTLLKLAKAGAGLLVGGAVLDAYLNLGERTDSSIETIRIPIGVATFRAVLAEGIPARWLEEPLDQLISRSLFRLRFLTEREALSPASFSYCYPLLHQVIFGRGMGCDTKTAEGKESALEQLSLALDIVSFHCVLGEQPLMPRKEMIEALILIINEYPSLSKVARTSLNTICETMAVTANVDDINAVLGGLFSQESNVRSACLHALVHLDLTDIDFSRELWVSCHDEEEANAKQALRLWEDNGMDVEPDYAEHLLPLLGHQNEFVRKSAAKAIGSSAEYYPETVAGTLSSLYGIYSEKAVPLFPEYDEFGLVIPSSLNKKDPWENRTGVALALRALAPFMAEDDLGPFFEFLIKDKALGDRSETVRNKMLDAGLAVVDAQGSEHVQQIMPTFEKYLDMPAIPDEVHDRIRESVVILFGCLARHLDEGDPKILNATEKLLETLKTPSEPVQQAVADCLPPLVKSIKDEVPQLVSRLLDTLLNAPKYGERRGAAYGLAGVIKGRGISALKEFNIITTLKQAVENKKQFEARQGALFAFETFSAILGRLFEPYIIQIIPLLLICFGDPVADIREATADTSRVIMSKISGHCVKLILPSLLSGLEDRQWRTKKGSVELLGSMAFCAPKQLSISLPTVVPRLTEVLTDSHAQVQAAANSALLNFGNVISNPEIQALVPILLSALSNPSGKTKDALNALLNTAFVHYIDAPSLALVMPILERGLRERSTDIKTKSAQIVGNMSSLTDQKDLVPYLSRLVPFVKEVLADPVPNARATAAKALGTMVEKLGEESFPDLVQELVQTLKSDTSGVDRQGAAQGLSEILAGLGMERLEGMLPEILANTNSSKAFVREGFISLLIYLPMTFGPRFQPYLGRIIPPILLGLADESEYVREVSLKAGRMIVFSYASKAVDLLLPELEKGLFDDNWRIRQSSVQLVGDLIFRITGQNKTTATPLVQTGDDAAGAALSTEESAEADDEDAGNVESIRRVLLEVLGKERRDRVLSALYIVRSDVSGVVRQASLQVWKAIVSNTPRTIKEILPVMMGMIIQSLASPTYDRRAIAARTLGDLVRKLGEGILAEIIPILQRGLESPQSDTRQGVCSGLGEILATASKIQITDFMEDIIPAVRRGLVDESHEVREAAARAFDGLHQHIGNRAIDEILPTLLSSLQSGENSEYALEALKEIMAVRANVVFPVLIPTLIQVPISAFNARALGSLVTVAGPALNRRLSAILLALMDSLGHEKDPDTIDALRSTVRAILLSIDDAEGTHTLMTLLFEAVKHESHLKRAEACEIVGVFCSESRQDISPYVAEWLRILIGLLDDRQPSVVQAAWGALNAVTKSLRKEDMEQMVVPVRRAILGVGVPGVDLPGFCLPKGISPILPIFLQGLMYGTNDTREQAALGIGDIIQRTSAEILKPFVTQITGPLIRIIGDRYPADVKSAILQTLSLLLTKVPALLKPFLPQLQRTFVKSLSDTSSSAVRKRAASALGILISLQTRVDPLVTELVTGVKASEEAGVRESMINALENVVTSAGKNMNEASKKAVAGVISEYLPGEESDLTVGTAKLFGALCKVCTVEEARPLVQEYVTKEQIPTYVSLLALNAVLANVPMLLEELGTVSDVVNMTVEGCSSSRFEVADMAVLAAGKMLLTEQMRKTELVDKLVNVLAGVIQAPKNGSNDTKRLAILAVKAIAVRDASVLHPYLSVLVPNILLCVRDRNTSIKLLAERAMVHLLQLLDGEYVMQAFIASASASTGKALNEYYTRYLSKIVQEQQSLYHQKGEDMLEEDVEDETEVMAVGREVGFIFDDY